MAVEDILRVFLATYFGAAAVLYTAKLLAFRARTGLDAQAFGPVGSGQWFGRVAFEGFRWSIFLACALRVAFPHIDPWFGQLHFLRVVGLEMLGAALMLAGLWIVIYTHSFMGNAWRSGVPREPAGPLITTGPYAVVRHPIFAGVHLGQVGFFLAWPTLFTLICLVVGVVVIQLQARIEETHLARRFGAAFDRYKRDTPGFIPGLKRNARRNAIIAD